MRKLGYVILFIIVALMVGIPVTMLANEGFKDMVLNGLAGVNAGISNTVAGVIAGIQANGIYQAYIGPYIVFWSIGIGIFLTLLFQKVLWPHRPSFAKGIVTQKTVVREEPRDNIITAENPTSTKSKPEEPKKEEAIVTEPAS
jgi:hypothetical protein